jgi:hypothetical protein
VTFTYAASERATRQVQYASRFKIPLHSRREFLEDARTALKTGAPLAVAGLGMSENHWMYYPIFLEERPGQTKLRVFHMQLIYNAWSQVGIFPPQPDFYLRYNEFFMEHVRRIDWLGLVLEPVMEPKIVHHYELRNKLINHLDLIPDKSIPDEPANCYVPFFKDKRILIVCPFAEFLKARATREIFEGVWSKTGKQWFDPAGVDALEFPYGFDPATAKYYATAIDLFEHIASEIARRDFDVALIAAGGLAVPLASYVKFLGKIAIDLGGELQFLLGVNGKRWRDDARWTREYGTAWWADLPDKYRPRQVGVAGAGAFW